MFGEDYLIGQTMVTVDNKKRIIIPKMTKREPGETLAICYDEDINKYKIYSITNIKEILDELTIELEQATTKAEKTKIKLKIYEISKSIIKTSIVSENGRLNIGDSFKTGEKINLIGCKNHLILDLNNQKNEIRHI